MSIILNALSRSERERLQAAGPRISVVSQPPPPAKRARWPIWLLGGLLLVNAALVGGYLLLEQRPRLAAIFGRPVTQPTGPGVEASTARSGSGEAMPRVRPGTASGGASEPERLTPESPVVVREAGAAESAESAVPRPAPVSAANAVQDAAAAQSETRPRASDDRTADARGDVIPTQEPEVAQPAPGPEADRAGEATPDAPLRVAQRLPAADSTSGSASAAVPEASEPAAAGPPPAVRPSSTTNPAERPSAAGAMLRDSESLAGLNGLAEGIAPRGADGASETAPDEGLAPKADPAPRPAMAAAPSAREVPEATRESLPRLRQLPTSVVARLPELRLYVHVFDPDPEKRFVITNLGKFTAGGEIDRGLRLEEVTADGMVLSYEGTRFRLERN